MAESTPSEPEMQIMRFLFNILLSCQFIVVFAQSSFAGDKLPVFVTIAPQKYFVQQIGDDLVHVQVMVKPGANPHTYEPKPRQMVAISRAKLYFAIGVEFEAAKLDGIIAVNPRITVVHTDQGIEKIPMVAHDHRKEADPYEKAKHHEAGENSGLDPHIWLSPSLVMVQARTILRALQAADPVHKDAYEVNYNRFISDIVKLDNELKATFAGKNGLGFMVFHPSWGYFAHSYGLKQIPIEIEGKNPKPAQLKTLIQHARLSNIKVLFVQPQFSTKSANLIAKEIHGQVVFADPLAENWLVNLREVAHKFRSALK